MLCGASPVSADPPPGGHNQIVPATENWRSSPWHGVIDGAGRVIPCRCRYKGTEFRLGELVCMQTPQGTVLTRCDLFLNNTSWIPTEQPCTISRAPAAVSVAAN